MSRRYESTVRPQRAAETRTRIVDAGCELLRATSIRDWRALTIRSVAERAGVNERTVYRHFANERGLRDAVMARLETDAGIDLDGLTLDRIVDVTRKTLAVVSSHPRSSNAHVDAELPDAASPDPASLDPTLNDAGQRQRGALLRAVTAQTADWPQQDREVAAAMFDVLWGVATFERLVGAWELDPDRAVGGIAWVMTLIESAIRADDRPGTAQTNSTP